MKKLFAIFSSLLIFAGIKAQTPVIKKETVQPAPKSLSPADSLKALKAGANIKQTVNAKAIKFDNIKKTGTTLPMKENTTTTKPGKY